MLVRMQSIIVLAPLQLREGNLKVTALIFLTISKTAVRITSPYDNPITKREFYCSDRHLVKLRKCQRNCACL